jgi:hypothetical protein
MYIDYNILNIYAHTHINIYACVIYTMKIYEKIILHNNYLIVYIV